MKTRQFQVFLSIVTATILLAGCFPTTPSTPSSIEMTQASLFAQATLTKIAVVAEVNMMLTQQAQTEQPEQPTEIPPTPIPPTPIPPTPIPPTPVPGISEIRIDFASGTTNTSVVGTMQAYKTLCYVFWAAKDQLIDVDLSSAQDAAISISSRTGIVLISPMGNEKSYRGYLPESGDWFIDVRSGASAVNFSLSLMIPQGLGFAAGTYVLTTTGNVPAGGVHNFIVYAFKTKRLKLAWCQLVTWRYPFMAWTGRS